MAMFNKSREGAPAEARINTVLGEGTSFNGQLKVEGSVLVNGDFEGTLSATETLVVGKTGSVRGGLSVRDATVSGRVKGKIVARDRVELQTGARLEGDVFAKSFMIEEGVFFQGNCSMGDDAVDEEQVLGPVPKSPPDLGLLGQRKS
jgi:cytoskeletal protein CcmA (bactofilin family)